MIDKLLHKIRRKLMKLRLQPIRVYCIHHVSENIDPLTMWKCDWMQMDEFKRKVMQMKASGVEFISLPEAHEKLKHDRLRSEKYAVLTADDGYKSILNLLPWLEEQWIPITLFVNTQYLDGKSWSAINEEQAWRTKPDVDMAKEVCPNLYLTEEELIKVASKPNVTIGMHGHEHLDATKHTIEAFLRNVERCQVALKDVPHTIPYFAYTWGRHNAETDAWLEANRMIPVLMDGEKNYNDASVVHREEIDK